MTEELLAPVTTTLEEVQRQLATIIDYDTVLVGHSLNCDLDVLKVGTEVFRQPFWKTPADELHQLAHPWIVDTSVIYHHTRGPPFKASLKWLASKWLQKEIQKPRKAGEIETVGHDSEEDARAAVELLRMKMANGKSMICSCSRLCSCLDARTPSRSVFRGICNGSRIHFRTTVSRRSEAHQ